MNYGELKTTVASYLHRTDLTNEIPGFIELAESRINTGLKVLENEGYAVLNSTDNPQPLPADYNDMSAVQTQIDRGPRALERVHPARMAQLQRFARDTGGGARWFTVQAKEITVWPFNVSNGVGPEIELEYWTQLAALDADSDTNAILDRWPQLYLYGALYEGYVFTAAPTQAAVALSTFVGELNEININAGSAKWGVAPAIQAG